MMDAIDVRTFGVGLAARQTLTIVACARCGMSRVANGTKTVRTPEGIAHICRVCPDRAA